LDTSQIPPFEQAGDLGLGQFAGYARNQSAARW
jgi:hypothetical protein